MIDLHTHVVPKQFPSMLGREGGLRWPQMEHGELGRAHVKISGEIYRTVTEECWNPLKRIEDMEREGVDRQVLSVMPELLNYWAKPEDSLIFCRSMNETISQMVRDYPDKFIGLGVVPLQDPELAAKELESVKNEYQLAGVQIGTNVEGVSIGDSKFWVFFEMAEKLNLAVFVHPINPLGQDRIVGAPILNNFIGYPTETTYAATSIITGLVLEKFPNLRICFSHGGGGFPAILPRLIYGWENGPGLREVLPKSPEEYVKKMFFDTLVYDQRMFNYLREVFSIDQLIIGSDYPFVIRETPPGKVIHNISNLSTEDYRRMKMENALRFLFG